MESHGRAVCNKSLLDRMRGQWSQQEAPGACKDYIQSGCHRVPMEVVWDYLIITKGQKRQQMSLEFKMYFFHLSLPVLIKCICRFLMTVDVSIKPFCLTH